MTHDTEKNNLSLIIPENYALERLDLVLSKLLPDYSRTQLQDWIEAGQVLLNNQPTKTKTKVKGGEIVSIHVTLKPQPEWVAQDLPLNIVHEDEALIIINKAVGMVVHPGAGNADRTLLNALLHHAPSLKDLPRAGILHRLDKDTSGLLVIAKTPAALRSLSSQLKKRSLLREYQAIVYGSFISGGKVDVAIARHHLLRKRMAVNEMGKPAITHYRIAEKFPHLTLLTVRLETGRTHQIRVHMNHIQHPIVGDVIYGGRVKLSKNMTPELIAALRQFKRQALHAFALGLTHPITGEWMRFEIDLPQDMQQLLLALRQDKAHNKA